MIKDKKVLLFTALVLAAELIFAAVRIYGLSGRQELAFSQEQLLLSGDILGNETETEVNSQGFYVDNSHGESVVTPDFQAKRGIYHISVEFEANGPSYPHECLSRVVAADDSSYEQLARLVESERVDLTEGLSSVEYRADIRDAGSFRVVNHINPAVDGQYILVYGVTVTRMTGQTILHELTVLLALFAVLDLILFLFFFRRERLLGWLERYGAAAAVVCGTVFMACYPLLSDGLYFGDDILYHLRRIVKLAEGISDGMFPVKLQAWSHGYGYAVGVGYGDMLLIPSALLCLLGFSLTFAYEFYIVLVTCITAAGSFAAFSRIGRSRLAGMAGCVLYTLAGYRLTSIYAGSTVGEFGAISFYPIIILGLWEIFSDAEDKRKAELTAAVGISFVIGTHTLSTLLTAIAIFLFCLIWLRRTLKREVLIPLLRTVGKILLLSLWFLVPLVDYLITMDLNTDDGGGFLLWDQTLDMTKLLVTMPDQSDVNGGYYYLGYAAVVIIFAAFGLLLAGRVKEKLIRGAMCRLAVLSLFFIFLTTRLMPWHGLMTRIPALYKAATIIQFPWHFAGPALGLLALLAVLCIRVLYTEDTMPVSAEKEAADGEDKIRIPAPAMGLVLIMTLLTLVQSGNYLALVARDGRTVLRLSTTGMDESWVDEFSIRGADIAISEGIGGITADEDGVTAEIVKRRGMTITAAVGNPADHEVKLRFPLWAYRGYKAKGAGVKPAVSEAEDHRIEITVPAGYSGEITVGFHEPWFWRIAELVSLCAWIIAAVFIFTGKSLIPAGLPQRKKTEEK